eukprot:TRINITY_DN109184_c0_g1_i1.p1 TRINITY_DN109184_c0_g1~~TRINITY_DN109184_c0_g1_i1.p1  ORF type:complete len:375 (+),score=72.51 TRINITY_DN109184_c0_g1_i1:37-1125(+)
MGNDPSILLCTELGRDGTPVAVEGSPGASSSKPQAGVRGSAPLPTEGIDPLVPKVAQAAQTGPPSFGGQVVSKEVQGDDSDNFLFSNEDTSFLNDVIAQIRSGSPLRGPGPVGDAPVEDAELEAMSLFVESEQSGGKVEPPGTSSGSGNGQMQKKRTFVQSLISKAAGKTTAAQKDHVETRGKTTTSSGVGERLPQKEELQSSEPSSEQCQTGQLGAKPPGPDERRWIEAALRRMFSMLGPSALDILVTEFREWKLPDSAVIFKQGTPVSSGPGLCVLLDGVVDVLHCQKAGKECEKVCTYDRCGQCFGELELIYDQQSTPRGPCGTRKLHWATVSTRTPVILWTVGKNALRHSLPVKRAVP